MKKIVLLFCVAFAFVFASCKSTTQETDNGAASLVDGQIETEEGGGVFGQEENVSASENSLAAVEASRQAAIEAGAKDLYGAAFAANDAALEALTALDDGKDHSKEYNELKYIPQIQFLQK